MKMIRDKFKKGFTLIELMVVVAVIAILATMLLVGLSGARKKARDARRLSDLREYQNLLELYYAQNGEYPNASGIVELKTKLQEVSDNSNLPDDPFCPSNSTNCKNSWAHYQYGHCGDQGYVLGAKLETSNSSVLQDDIDGNVCDVDCNDPWYCVGINTSD